MRVLNILTRRCLPLEKFDTAVAFYENLIGQSLVFGSDFGPVPYGIEEHVRIVEEVLPSPADRELVFWKTSNKVFRLGLSDTDPATKDLRLTSQDRSSPNPALAA